MQWSGETEERECDGIYRERARQVPAKEEDGKLESHTTASCVCHRAWTAIIEKESL